MRLRLLLIVTLLLTLPVRSETLTLGYINLEPHICQNEHGVATGPLVKFLSQHIGPAMGVTVEFQYMPLTRVMTEMKKGNLSGMAIFGETEDRLSQFVFPTQNFFSMSPVIAMLKKHPLQQVTFPDSLHNLNIGYVSGAIHSPYIKQNQITFSNIYGTNTWIRNLDRLLKKRIDAIYAPIELNMQAVALKANALDKINIIRIPEQPIKLFTVFSGAQNVSGRELISRYDSAFLQVDGDQLYQRLLTDELHHLSQHTTGAPPDNQP